MSELILKRIKAYKAILTENIEDTIEYLNECVDNKNYGLASWNQGRIDGLKSALTILDTVSNMEEDNVDSWIEYKSLDELSNKLNEALNKETTENWEDKFIISL